MSEWASSFTFEHACAFLTGFLLCRLLISWGAMWRVCCRQHYQTHKTCRCGDCVNERERAA